MYLTCWERQKQNQMCCHGLRVGVTKGHEEACYLLFVFRNRVSLCSPGWPPTHDPSASASQVLRLQVCTTMSDPEETFFFLVVLGFEFRAYTLSHSTSPFLGMGFFEIRVLRVISPGWLQIVTLLISASWVARIIGMSHRCLTFFSYFDCSHDYVTIYL
jgi:hypothetical protein